MKLKRFVSAFLFFLTLTACSFSIPAQPTATPSLRSTQTVSPSTATPASSPTSRGEAAQEQPVELKGTFQYTNDIIITYYVEHAVALTDMYGFVKRDPQWTIPVASQTLGFLKIDPQSKSGTFDLDLPARPSGQVVNVNPQSKTEQGVQIFALAYSPNLTGGPFAEGDDIERGWPSYLASVKTDSENNDEVTGGKLVIWAPDDQQSFPSSFGADGLLFTADDPAMTVPQGYSVIDLDQKPFTIIRSAQVELTLYEPQDAALKDFSALTYQKAFDQMFEIVRKEYAFNGIKDKQPDWDQLYAELSPRVKEAEQNKDAEAYYRALRDFTLAFKDGHVGLSGGETGQKVFSEEFSGGFGFAIRQLDDGRAMVIYVQPEGPAEKAGMKIGAVVTQFNGKLIDQAIQTVAPPGPESMESSLRYEQARYLVRAPIDSKASVTFQNPQAGSAQTAELTAIAETNSLSVTSPYRDTDPNALPVEYIVSSSSIGYVRITSNYDDLNLIERLFQRALVKFQENGIQTIIIDLRANSGGAPLGLAGYFTDQEIPLGQRQYYSDKTGQFEPEGTPDTITPKEEQYHFEKMFLLVDHACASACELEAYGFSKIPGLVILGQTPTAGTEAEVSRGQFKLPEGMSLQVPTGRFVLPDGGIFLEGSGVQPTERVPVDETTALPNQDAVLQKALDLAQ